MKPGDDVTVRMFGKGQPARVVTVCADGDLICERIGDDLPAWIPRVGRFEPRYVFARTAEKESDSR